jgi:hypothetical protein
LPGWGVAQFGLLAQIAYDNDGVKHEILLWVDQAAVAAGLGV